MFILQRVCVCVQCVCLFECNDAEVSRAENIHPEGGEQADACHSDINDGCPLMSTRGSVRLPSQPFPNVQLYDHLNIPKKKKYFG